MQPPSNSTVLKQTNPKPKSLVYGRERAEKQKARIRVGIPGVSLTSLETAFFNRQATSLALGSPVKQAQANTEREPEYRSDYTKDTVAGAYDVTLLEA